MGRPLAGFGFFNAEKRFDAETENFEKVKIHAFLEQEYAPAAWVKNTDYNVGDKVAQGGKNYICKTANNQSTFLAKEAAPAAWQATHEYQIGDKVTESGQYYECTKQHTSSEAFATDSANWKSYTLVVYWAEYTLGGGALEDAKIIKQVGYNKYLVAAVADENRQGVVMLVDNTEATVAGTGYIKVTKITGTETKYAKKIVRNVVETFDGEVLTYKYDLTEGDDGFEGAFCKDEELVDCYIEVL